MKLLEEEIWLHGRAVAITMVGVLNALLLFVNGTSQLRISPAKPDMKRPSACPTQAASLR